MKLKNFILCLGIALVMAGADCLVAKAPQAALLINIIFWLAIAQGAVALVAVADLTQARWVVPVKKDLFALIPLIPVFALLFLFVAPQWGIYPKIIKQSAWFDQWFFVVRNAIFLLIAWLFAWKYSRVSLQNSENKGLWAVLYLLSFVTMQSVVAFNWVMPLHFPWVSTLFGAYFFIEALYMGIGFGTVICLVNLERAGDSKPKELVKTGYDIGLLLFGFCILWMSLFFTHLMIIWYGNIPEEQALYITIAQHYSPAHWIVLACLFGVPFVTLPFRKVKSDPKAVVVVAGVVFVGMLLEKWLMFVPAATISYPALAIHFAFMAAMAFLTMKAHYRS